MLVLPFARPVLLFAEHAQPPLLVPVASLKTTELLLMVSVSAELDSIKLSLLTVQLVASLVILSAHHASLPPLDALIAMLPPTVSWVSILQAINSALVFQVSVKTPMDSASKPTATPILSAPTAKPYLVGRFASTASLLLIENLFYLSRNVDAKLDYLIETEFVLDAELAVEDVTVLLFAGLVLLVLLTITMVLALVLKDSSSLLNPSDSADNVLSSVPPALLSPSASLANLISKSLAVNVSVLEVDSSTVKVSAYHASMVAANAKMPLLVKSATFLFFFRLILASLDADQVSINQASLVWLVLKDVLLVPRLTSAPSADLEDLPTTDSAMSTVLLDQ